ncbi:MAG: tetratricopeptide repeat protein, partial [Dokdonella sp.]
TKPQNPAFLLHLAVAQFRSKRIDDAKATLERLLSFHPHDAVAAFHLGLVHEVDADLDAAELAFRHALDLRPQYVEASIRLGLLLQGRGRFGQALLPLLAAWDRQRPQLAEPIARALLETGQFARALEFCDIATRFAPQRGQSWLVRGIALRRLGQAHAAREALARALELGPESALGLCEFGCNARELGRFDEGQRALALAKALAPMWSVPRWLHDLAIPVLPSDRDQVLASLQHYESSITALIGDIESDTPGARTGALDGLERTLPFSLHYLPVDTTAATLRFGDLAAVVVRETADPSLRAATQWIARAHGGRLRVGIVSCELRRHTIMRYFGGWLDGLNAERIDLHVWHLGTVRDEVSDRIAARVGAFHHLPLMPTLELATHIRAAQLDVLVYLEVGMDSRAQVLGSLRLAPAQCAAYGHPVTTGLHEIDWFISGEAMEPDSAQAHYRERLALLPGLGVVPEMPPPPGDGSWLQREQGRPLVLCLQSLFKLVPEFDEAIARIVAATDAQVVLFEFPQALGARYLERLGGVFTRHGLSLQRSVRIVGRKSHADYLGAIAASDLVVDSMGFSGGATSLDALSVATPVVTIEGEFMRGRQTAAMLRMVGVEELIATDVDDYVAIVVGLCADVTRRDEFRSRIAAKAARLFADDRVVPALEQFLFRAAEAAAKRSP